MGRSLSRILHLRQPQHQTEDQNEEVNTLPGMQEDGEPVAAEVLTGEGKYRPNCDIVQNAPGLVKMVQPEEDAIRYPVPFAKPACHSG